MIAIANSILVYLITMIYVGSLSYCITIFAMIRFEERTKPTKIEVAALLLLVLTAIPVVFMWRLAWCF